MLSESIHMIQLNHWFATISIPLLNQCFGYYYTIAISVLPSDITGQILENTYGKFRLKIRDTWRWNFTDNENNPVR